MHFGLGLQSFVGICWHEIRPTSNLVASGSVLDHALRQYFAMKNPPRKPVPDLKTSLTPAVGYATLTKLVDGRLQGRVLLVGSSQAQICIGVA